VSIPKCLELPAEKSNGGVQADIVVAVKNT